MRINEQITIIILRHSAAVVDVYRHGVLVWKASGCIPVHQDFLVIRHPASIEEA